jgi:hypothetical protein
MKKLAAGTSIDLSFLQRGGFIDSGPSLPLWLRTLPCDHGRLGIGHLGVLSDIDALSVVTELDRDAIGIETIDRVNKAVVNDIRHVESR